MAYAERTKVTVGQTKTEIEDMVKLKGATSFISGHRDGRAVVLFELEDRRMQFSIPMPEETSGQRAARLERERWRALFLCIKSKFVSVETGVESLEEAFLAHIVVSGGGTVYENLQTELKIAGPMGKLPSLLPSGKR